MLVGWLFGMLNYAWCAIVAATRHALLLLFKREMYEIALLQTVLMMVVKCFRQA